MSQPIHLRINDGPLKISELADAAAQAGKEIAVSVFFERLYGFAESVEFQLVPGKDSKLFDPSKASAAKETKEASLKATISSEARPGRYQATVEAKLKFNGQILIAGGEPSTMVTPERLVKQEEKNRVTNAGPDLLVTQFFHTESTRK